MLNVHKDSVIFVRETCWATNSTICLNVNTSQKKEISTKILFTACEYIEYQKLMSTENLKLLKQLSRFISIVLSKF